MPVISAINGFGVFVVFEAKNQSSRSYILKRLALTGKTE
jgi:hypothetical protein